MTTVRLPVEYEQKLASLAEARHSSRSDIIKEALDLLFRREESGKDSYELGEPFFGRYGSADGNRSTTYKARLKEKINAKHHPD